MFYVALFIFDEDGPTLTPVRRLAHNVSKALRLSKTRREMSAFRDTEPKIFAYRMSQARRPLEPTTPASRSRQARTHQTSLASWRTDLPSSMRNTREQRMYARTRQERRRHVYAPPSFQSSVLYSCVSELTIIDRMGRRGGYRRKGAPFRSGAGNGAVYRTVHMCALNTFFVSPSQAAMHSFTPKHVKNETSKTKFEPTDGHSNTVEFQVPIGQFQLLHRLGQATKAKTPARRRESIQSSYLSGRCLVMSGISGPGRINTAYKNEAGHQVPLNMHTRAARTFYSKLMENLRTSLRFTSNKK